jgi:ADP-ribose pyrophosphatase
MKNSYFDDTNLKPWKVVDEKTVYEHPPWLKVSVQSVELPDGQLVPDYLKLVTQDFVEVVAFTSTGNVIIEKQYKHGIGEISITLPAGNIDPNERSEAAAVRELREETGYKAGTLEKLGSFVVHGNYGCATAHLFIATEVVKVTEPDNGDLEEMIITEMPIAELKQAVLDGRVKAISGAAAILIAADPSLVITESGASFENS